MTRRRRIWHAEVAPLVATLRASRDDALADAVVLAQEAAGRGGAQRATFMFQPEEEERDALDRALHGLRS